MLKYIGRYIINILIAIDQFFNALFLGDPDETLSSRFGKWMTTAPKKSARWYIAVTVCMVLNKLDKDHCIDHIEDDEGADAIWRNMRRK